jgi:cellulose synthase operon protein C
MKKILLSSVALAILAGAGFLVYQNRPSKRHANHMIKARLFAQEGNLMAARLEYEKAYGITGGYSPYVTLEVLRLVNRMSLNEKNLPEALENTRKFTQAHPENKEGWLTLGELSFQAGEPGAAFDAIESALSIDTAYFPARLLLGRVRTQQGRLDLAEEQLRFLFDRYPDSLPALLPLAENLLRQGQMAESRAFLRKAREVDPKNSAVWMLLVDGYLLERKTDSAQAMLEAWMKAAPESARLAVLRKSKLLSLTGKPEEARAALEPYLEKKKENLPAFYQLALLFAKRGQYDSAVKVYDRVKDIEPAATGEVLYLKACLHLGSRNPARALEALKTLKMGERGNSLMPMLAATYYALGQEHKVDEMLAERPDSVRATLASAFRQINPDLDFIAPWALVNYYQANQDALAAFQAMQDLYRKWPSSPVAATLYAGALVSLRQHGEAVAVLEKLPKPTLAQSITLVHAYARSGKGEKARALAEKLAKENPSQRGIHLFLADYHLSRKERDKSLEHLLAESALDTGNVVVLNNLAWEYGIARGDLGKARPYLDRLRRRKTLDPRILDTMGWILVRNGDGSGEEYLRWALSLVPDQPTLQYHMAWHLAKTGRTEEARTLVGKALASPRPFEERKDAEALSSGLVAGGPASPAKAD